MYYHRPNLPVPKSQLYNLYDFPHTSASFEEVAWFSVRICNSRKVSIDWPTIHIAKPALLLLLFSFSAIDLCFVSLLPSIFREFCDVHCIDLVDLI
jgi:hypothetical protein